MRFKNLLTITVILGLLFGILQWNGFSTLQLHGIQLFGVGSNPAASFLGIIVGLHVLHVLGGIVALLILFYRSLRSKTKMYNSVPVELVATYWHFVDILWIYLFVFLMVA